MNEIILRALKRIRPAPLQSAIVRATGLDRRRIVEFEGSRFSVNPASCLGTQLIERAFEPETVAILRRYLRPGDTFLDIGANEGVVSVLASSIVGPAGAVI